MQDLKYPRAGSKGKSNRRKVQKEPRDWKKLFRRLLHLGLALGSASLAVAGVIVAAQLLLASDYFRVATVRVENQQRVGADEIIARSDIRPGASLFDLDLEMIGRKIEEEPWIAAARVERVFPRGVTIRVEERAPRAVVAVDYLYYLDAGGVVFKMLEAEDCLDYPVFTGLDQRFLLEHPEEARELFLKGIGLIDQLAGRTVFGLRQVSEIRIDPEEGFQLFTYASGVPILLGDGDFGAKLDRLEKIYPELEPRLAVLQYIDLNVSDRVIVKVDGNRYPVQGCGDKQAKGCGGGPSRPT